MLTVKVITSSLGVRMSPLNYHIRFLKLNMLTADDEYSRHNRENLLIVCIGVPTPLKNTSPLFLARPLPLKFAECYINSYWKPFGSQHVNESHKLMKSAEKHFCPTFLSLWAKLTLKKSFLVRSDNLGLLVTANYEYSRHNRENLPLPIHMQLSKKPNKSCCFFIAFWKSTSNIKHSEKQLNAIAYVFLKLLTDKDVVTETHKRSYFWKPFGSQRVKLSENVTRIKKTALNKMMHTDLKLGLKR